MSTLDGQTPGDTIASLRADLEAVSAGLEAAADHRAGLAEDIAAAGLDRDATTAALARLEASVAALAADPAPETPTPAQSDGPGEDGPGEDEPSAWVDYAGAEDWVELADWVDWLLVTYDLAESWRVLSCWPAHPGVAEELAALRSSWREAALAAAAGRGEALVVWHSTHLAAVLSRVNSHYGTKSCHSARHAPRMRPRLADRTLIDVRSAAAAEADPAAAS